MQSKASAMFSRIAPRKARMIINFVRGKNAAEAIQILQFTPKAAAPVVKKAVIAPKATVALKPAASVAPLKPIKTAFNKTTLQTHLAEVAGVEPKVAKAVLAALEATIVAFMSKKGLGEFTLPGLLKITAQAIPAKKKRRGIDPFTKVEREFAAKPATVRVKVRPLKKIKDASL